MQAFRSYVPKQHFGVDQAWQWPQDPRLKKFNIKFFSIAIELEKIQSRDWSFSIFKIGYVNQSRSISETNLDQYFSEQHLGSRSFVSAVAWLYTRLLERKLPACRKVAPEGAWWKLLTCFHDLVNKHGADAFKLGPYDRMKSTQACSAEGLHCNAEIIKRLVVFFVRSLTESHAPFF